MHKQTNKGQNPDSEKTVLVCFETITVHLNVTNLIVHCFMLMPERLVAHRGGARESTEQPSMGEHGGLGAQPSQAEIYLQAHNQRQRSTVQWGSFGLFHPNKHPFASRMLQLT